MRQPKKRSKAARVIVAWGGDVNLGRRQHYRTKEDFEEPLGRIPALTEADLRIVNLECVVATTGEQGVEKGEQAPYYYRARPEMLRILTAAQVDLVAVANNHSGDYGPEALLEQAKWLDSVGIGHAGSGATVHEAVAPVVRRIGGLGVALFSLDATQPHFAAGLSHPGTAYVDPAQADRWAPVLASRIGEARKRADAVLVAVHWGRNFEQRPDDAKRRIGHVLIDAGADAVLGAGAHVLQGVEVYRGKPIIHDAGDLLFDAIRRESDEGAVFHLELTSDGVRGLRMFPIRVGFGASHPVTGEEARRAVRRFAAQCGELGTLLEEKGESGRVASLDEGAAGRRPHRAERKVDLAVVDQARHLVRPEWIAASVPEDARLEPVDLGPLRLLGIRVRPHRIERRQLLWVESFWTADQALDEDARIDIRAVPVPAAEGGVWGASMDHDPCDWMMPTRRWTPGTVYRDYYALRPPAASRAKNGEFGIRVGIVSNGHGSPSVMLPKPVIAVELAKSRVKPMAAIRYRTAFPEVAKTCRPGETWNAEQLVAVTGGTWLVPPPPGWHVHSVVSLLSAVSVRPAPVMYVCHRREDRHRHEQYVGPATNMWDTHQRLPDLAEQLAGAIVSRPVAGLPPGFPLLKVEDPIRAIIELGLAARERFAGPVVAVTGTVGKSSTLSMLHHMLEGEKPVLTTLDNYNSRVGAPSMLASLAPDHGAAILEVAQSALWKKDGPITRLVRPTVAAITEIGLSQTSRLRSVNDVATNKSRIFDGLAGPRVAVVADYLACFERIHQAALEHARKVVVTGYGEAADFRILNIRAQGTGSEVEVRCPSGKTLRFFLPVPSVGMARNAVIALAITHAMGRDADEVAARLRTFSLDEARLERHRIGELGRLVDVIDDSWNAEYLSMANALTVLADERPRPGGRRIAVLGRIVHLGEMSQQIHESLAGPVLEARPDIVVTHGREIEPLRDVLPDSMLGPHFEDAGSLADHLASSLHDADVVLLKGSRRDSDFGDLLSELKKRLVVPT